MNFYKYLTNVHLELSYTKNLNKVQVLNKVG